MPPAFRADQVGSLLRPAKLLDARALHQRAQLDRDGLTRAEDEAILQRNIARLVHDRSDRPRTGDPTRAVRPN